MMILREPGMALLLSGILLMSCEARFSQYSEQHIVESLGKVSDWNDRVVEQTIHTDLYAKVIGRWNASWPTIAKLKDEASVVDPYGSPESADRPYKISRQCIDGVLRLVEGLFLKETWALQMVDASGKVPSGLLLGHVKWIGTYGECLNASSSKQTEVQQMENGTVLGGYCLVTFGNNKTASAQGPLDLRFGLGICIPRTCNSTDAMALVNLVLSELTNKIHAVKADCRDNSALPLDSGAIVVITILCVLGALLILGTCLDIISNHCHLEAVVIANGHSKDDAQDDDDDDDDDDVSLLVDHHSDQAKQKPRFILLQTDGSLHRFLVAFSILANAKKIVAMEQTQTNDRSLQALHGIRVISLTWVMLCHNFIFALPIASNPSEFLNLIKRFTFQVIINASVSVDTFFVLSGTLLSYFLLRDIRDKGGLRNINWPKFFFHRFWRLTPLYMIVLAIYTTLVKYLGSGPLWPQESDEYCTNNWWTNLLYINNIVHKDKMCLSWSWYLANDTQFFLLSSVFLALLYKWALLGGIVIFIFMLTSSITTGVITYVHDYPPSTAGVNFRNLTTAIPWFNDVYFVPWCRINPYLIGILLGYILYKTNCKLRMHRALVVIGWCLAAVCNLSVLYGLYEVARGHYLSPSISALYGSVNRTVWGLGVAWVILACATGNGGFVNDLLSLPVMQPFSRLTYAAYLIHPMLMLWYYFNLKVPLFIEDITMVYLFFGHLVLTYIGSFVFSIAFESPMINLEKLFLRNHKNNNIFKD